MSCIKTKHFDRSAEFVTLFSSIFAGDYNLSSTEQWESVKNATHSASLSTVGKKKGTRQNDWCDSSSPRLDPLIETRRTVLKAYNPSPESLNALRSARNGVQKKSGPTQMGTG